MRPHREAIGQDGAVQHDDATPREIADRYVETLADLNPISRGLRATDR